MSDSLFGPMDSQAFGILDAFRSTLDKALPLKPKHRKGLPQDIRNLSRLLTRERSALGGGYLAKPENLSAYVRWFLPWNLIRLVTLIQGLDREVGFSLPEEAEILDVGAGPLTGMLALWIALPRLRERPIHFTCLDSSPSPMRTGLALFEQLAGSKSLWRATLVKGALGTRLRRKADLVLALNALNEGAGKEMEEFSEKVASWTVPALAPGGRLLVVEPGARSCAALVSAIRGEFMDRGLVPLSPCPHTGECPMPGEPGTQWCHFNFQPASPRWLAELSREAGLPKSRASLSFLLAAHPENGTKPPRDDQDEIPARVVSDFFPLPGTGREGAYCCSSLGLGLLTLDKSATEDYPSGRRFWAAATGEGDPKSGAVILRPASSGSARPGQKTKAKG